MTGLLACAAAWCAQAQDTPTLAPEMEAVAYFAAQGSADNPVGAYVEGEEALAAGDGASATAIAAMAIGPGATALGDRAIAIGRNALVRIRDGLALGPEARAEVEYAMAFGNLSKVSGQQAIAMGLRSEVAGVGSIGLGSYSRAAGRLATSLGYGGQGNGDYALALGAFSRANARRSVALGTSAIADRADTVSVGAPGAERQIVNVRAGSQDTDAVNVAQLREETAAFHAQGKGAAQAEGTGATAAGRASVASGADSVALGARAQAGESDSVAIGAGARAREAGVVSFGSGDGEGGLAVRRLVNVAPGLVAAGSAQAINGGQLFDAMHQALGLVDRRLGEVVGQTLAANTLGIDARAPAVDAVAVGRAAEAGAPAGTALGAGARVEAPARGAVALGEGAIADRAATVSVGRAGAERQLVNVAPGTQDTDAVNKAQLDTGVARANAYTEQRTAALSDAFAGYRRDVDDRFRQQDRRIDQQGAMNAAMLNMASSAAGIRTDNRVGVGVGFQSGASAVSIGYQRALSPRASLTLGGAFGGGEAALGFGAGVGW